MIPIAIEFDLISKANEASAGQQCYFLQGKSSSFSYSSEVRFGLGKQRSLKAA